MVLRRQEEMERSKYSPCWMIRPRLRSFPIVDQHFEGYEAVKILSSTAFVEERYQGCKGMHCTEMLAERHRGI